MIQSTKKEAGDLYGSPALSFINFAPYRLMLRQVRD